MGIVRYRENALIKGEKLNFCKCSKPNRSSCSRCRKKARKRMVSSHEIAQAALWVITSWGSFCQCGEAMALGEQLSSPKSGLEQLGAMGSSLADV